MSIHYAPTVRYVSLRSQSFALNVLISWQARFKEKKYRVFACLETTKIN